VAGQVGVDGVDGVGGGGVGDRVVGGDLGFAQTGARQLSSATVMGPFEAVSASNMGPPGLPN
jgi:hypothetical protein